ncbi:unnamed protein product [Boreogadus saida]
MHWKGQHIGTTLSPCRRRSSPLWGSWQPAVSNGNWQTDPRNGIPLPPDLPPPELDPEAQPSPRQVRFQQGARVCADVMRRL